MRRKNAPRSIWMNIGLSCCLTLGVSLAVTAAGAQTAPLTFTDGTFNDGDWTAKKIADTTAGQGATFSASQDKVNGAPAPSRLTVHSYNLGLIRVAHLKSGSTYTPAAGGAIGSLSYSYDLRYYGPEPGILGVAYALLLRQNGTYYIGPQDAIRNDAWERSARQNLTAADFQRVADDGPGQGPAHPDFSCAGATIELGYQTANSNPNAGSQDKTTSGLDNWSVSVVEPQPCCLKTVSESVLCAADGTSDYVYSFQVTNRSTTNAYHLLFVDLPLPVTVTSNDVDFTGEPGGFLAPGKTSGKKTVRIHGANPGTLTFRFLLLDQNGSQCCAVPHALVLPDCHCAQVLSDGAGCSAAGGYDYTFTLQNLTNKAPIRYALLTATTPGLAITQSSAPIAPPLAFAGTTTETVNFSGIAAQPGATLCFKLGVHDTTLTQCCAIDRCVTLPLSFCPSPPVGRRDLNLSLSTGQGSSPAEAAASGELPQAAADPSWTVTVPGPAHPAQSVLSPDADWPWAIPGSAWISRDATAASAAGGSATRYR
nr:hypothetical protein [Acidobacteriota bacterium]